MQAEAAHRLPDAATESDVRDREGGELMKKKITDGRTRMTARGGEDYITRCGDGRGGEEGRDGRAE